MSIKQAHQNNYNDVIEKICQLHGEEHKICTLSVTFQVTDACNLQCSYCYQINKQHHVMSLQIAKDFIDILLENKANISNYINITDIPAVILDFIGGEPFLQIDLIEEITEYFRQRTIELNHPWQYTYMLSICSNGTLYFTPKVQQYIKKHQDKLSFNISIDGNKKLHDTCRVFPDGSGSYDQAIAAVHHFKKYYKNDISTKMTLSPTNIMYTSDAIINLIDEQYKDIFANCIFEKGWNIDHAKIYYYELKKIADYILANDLEEELYFSIFSFSYSPQDISENQNFCGGNGQMIAIDYKGDVYPCIRFMESSLGDTVRPLKVGNIYTGLMTNPQDIQDMKDLQAVNRINQSEQKCLDCPISYGCSWCQAYNYQDSKQICHRATYTCDMHKAASLATSYFWNKCYIKHNDTDRFHIYLSDDEALKIINQEELNMLHNLEK